MTIFLFYIFYYYYYYLLLLFFDGVPNQDRATSHALAERPQVSQEN